jgi:hypothetical protein
MDGLLAQIRAGSQNPEISEYFLCNKHLEPIGVDSTCLDFIVSCYLENFDIEMYNRISANFDGYMYKGYDTTCDAFLEDKVRKRFMDVIFCDDPLLKIKTCAHYTIDTMGCVDACSHYKYPSKYFDMLPNMHIQKYGCLGDHRPLIDEALRNGDIIGAIEQCVCSAKSINVGESTTFSSLLAALFDCDANKIIELPDGTSCTPEEALRWLDAQEK